MIKWDVSLSFHFAKMKELIWAITYDFCIMFDIILMLYLYIVMRTTYISVLWQYQKGCPDERKNDLPLSPDMFSYFQVTLLPPLWFCPYCQYFACTFWCPARTDGKVLEFLVVWKFSFMTTLNYSLLFDLTFWYFVLSAFFRSSAYNIFMAHCSDFLTPLMGVMKDPYVGSFCSPSKIHFSSLSLRIWELRSFFNLAVLLTHCGRRCNMSPDGLPTISVSISPSLFLFLQPVRIRSTLQCRQKSPRLLLRSQTSNFHL